MTDDRLRRALTGEELDTCWKVFTYEVDMWTRLSDYLSPDEPDHEEFRGFRQGVRNAVVESCILHCRNACDVLLSTGRRRDDLRLADMLPDFHHRALDDLRAAYGIRERPGDVAHTLHYMALEPWLGRGARGDYGAALCRVRPIILAVLGALNEYAGPAIREALDRYTLRTSGGSQDEH